jgi:hypothetical protein
MNEGTPSALAPWGEALRFILANFAAVSAIIIGAGAVASSFFLFGYVVFFDRQLIWLVEASDIFKVGLVAASVMSTAVMYFAMTGVKDALDDHSRGYPRWTPYITPALFSLFAGYWAWRGYREGWSEHAVAAWAFLLLSAVNALSVVLMHFYMAGRLAAVIGLLALTTPIVALLFGSLAALTVKNAKGAFTVDVALHGERRIMVGAKLIMITSRHAAFYLDPKVIVLPVDAVVRMERRIGGAD